MRRIGWLAIVALALGIAACGSDDDDAGAMLDAGTAGTVGGEWTDENWPGGAGGAMGMPHDSDRGDWQSGETYSDWQENDFVDPTEDPLCTFGIDVDTGSYTLMRRDVTRGSLPVPNGVRTEEYLNYFTYGYEPPAQEAADAFSIHLAGAPSPFGEGLHLLRIGLQGKEVPQIDRPRANLVFLVDVSGSMASDDKLGLVKRSLRMLVDELRADDTIGIVRYAGDAGVHLPSTPVAQREEILRAIDQLQAGGSTYGEAGIRLAYDLAEDHFVEGGINRVILATDGDMNVGLVGDELVELIRDFRERGIYLTTLGFGSGNYNDSLMERLADEGNGNYAYIDSLPEAERVFRRDLLSTLIVIGRDVKIQVTLDPDAVVRYRLLGYENRSIPDEEFENPTHDTGDIGSGHNVTALIELELDPAVLEPGAAPARVALVAVRYKEPEATEDRLVEQAFDVTDFSSSIDAAPANLRFAAAVAEYAEILRRSMHSEGARFDEVIEMASGAAGGDPDKLEFLELAGLARDLWHARFGVSSTD